MSDLKPTADERREVAARLREIEPTYRDKMDSPDLLSSLIVQVKAPYAKDFINRLAELIEPEERTCRMELCDTGEEFMPECREEYLMCEHCKFVGYYVQVSESADYWCAKPNFCPNCGARVKGEADAQA